MRGHGGNEVPHRGGTIGDQDDDQEVGIEALGGGLEVGHAVDDGGEDGGVDDGVGQLREGAGEKVGGDAVGAGEVLAHEDFDFGGEGLYI